MRFVVHLSQRRKGEVRVEAADSLEAILKVKRLIFTNALPKGAMGEESRPIVSFTQEAP